MNLGTLYGELYKFKYEKDIEYIRSRDIARERGESAKAVGRLMTEAEQRGWVENWNEAKLVRWRILI